MHPFYSSWSLWSCCCFIFCITACGGTPESPLMEETPIKTSWTKSELDQTDVYAIAGDYYEIQIGIKGKELTGVYRDPQAKDETCLFFFEGIIGTKNPIEVQCYNPTNTKAPFKGFFKILGDAMIIQLAQTPSKQCSGEFTDNVGRSVVLDTKQDWSSIRMVQHPTHLHEQPILESPKSEITLKRGTVVAILEQRNTWLRVEILDGSDTQGWISQHGLYPLIEL